MKIILISTAALLLLAGAGCEYHEYQTIRPYEPQEATSEATPGSETIGPAAQTDQEEVIPPNDGGGMTGSEAEAEPDPEPEPEPDAVAGPEAPPADDPESVPPFEITPSTRLDPNVAQTIADAVNTNASATETDVPLHQVTAVPLYHVTATTCRDDQVRGEDGQCHCDVSNASALVQCLAETLSKRF